MGKETVAEDSDAEEADDQQHQHEDAAEVQEKSLTTTKRPRGAHLGRKRAFSHRLILTMRQQVEIIKLYESSSTECDMPSLAALGQWAHRSSKLESAPSTGVSSRLLKKRASLMSKRPCLKP